MMPTLLWHAAAPCRLGDPRWWYPPLDAPDPRPFYEAGRSVCRTCPVWQECNEAGAEEKFGMWGGLTPRERTGKRLFPCGTWVRYRQGCGCVRCSTAHDAVVSLAAQAS